MTARWPAGSLLGAVAGLGEGVELYAVTDGDVDFAEAAEAAAACAGRGCSLLVATSAASVQACEQLLALEQSGAVGELRVMAHHAVLAMNAHRGQGVIRVLGRHLRLARSHAKFAVATLGDRHVGLVTSANLNRNRRAESYWVTRDAEVARHLLEFVASCEAAGSLPGRGAAYYYDSWCTILGGGVVPSGSLEEEMALWR